MQLLPASLDDLVFEGRNRAYGAYQLRQQYWRNLASAGSITLAVCSLLFITWRTWPAAQPQLLAKNPVILVTITPPLTSVEKPKPAALAPAHAAAPARTRTHAAPDIRTRVAKDDLVPPPAARPTVAEVPEVDGLIGPPTAGPTSALTTAAGPGGPATDPSPAPATTEAFTFVEKMPEFAGGQAALLRYLRDHLRYPSQALRDQAEGRVFISFVVGANGIITDVKVLKGLGFGLDEEALRVVRQMPAWQPGYQAQRAVAVRFTLPITFKMQ